MNADEIVKTLSIQMAEKNREIEALTVKLSEFQRREKAAEKCIQDIETYLELGSGKFIKSTIDKWRGVQEDNP